MADIKPIETIYNGYKFRSRLEARWAVFFDECEIPYEYEPEGFSINNLYGYLPDFYLPWFDCYVEIKPKHIDLTKPIKKLEDLFVGIPCICMLCVGDPLDDDMRIIANDTTDSSGGGPNEFYAHFLKGIHFINKWGVECLSGKHWIVIAADGERSDRQFYKSDWTPAAVVNSEAIIGYRDDFENQKIKARQSRFEHNEYKG